MDEEEARELIDHLSGDEHAWVDFKEDYSIGGTSYHTAEFIKDIASLANTRTDQEAHYIIIGVNDEGDLRGISQGAEEYDGKGPRHIFSYDESDIQEIVDINLNPSPELVWYTFPGESITFGVLEITPIPNPPRITTQDQNDSQGNRVLHREHIFIRKGSGKKIAGREEVESLIKYRIESQRDQILSGISKAIEIGPEWIERFGDAFPSDQGIPISTAADPEEGDIALAQRLTREPATSLDTQLNEDISQWKHRGDDFVENNALFEYYCNPDELTIDVISTKFLTQSAIKNHLLGAFWLSKTSEEQQSEILLETPNIYYRVEIAGQLLLLLNDEETFSKLLEQSSSDAEYGTLRRCSQKMGNTVDDRVNYVLRNREHSLKHKTWSDEFDVMELDVEEINSLIIRISRYLSELYEDDPSHYQARSLIEEFREALWDLEVMLGGNIF